MEHRQFIAFAGGTDNSGFKNSEDEVVKWAKSRLGNKPQLEHVIICEATSKVVRQESPIKQVPLSPKPQVANLEPGQGNKTFTMEVDNTAQAIPTSELKEMERIAPTTSELKSNGAGFYAEAKPSALDF